MERKGKSHRGDGAAGKPFMVSRTLSRLPVGPYLPRSEKLGKEKSRRLGERASGSPAHPAQGFPLQKTPSRGDPLGPTPNLNRSSPMGSFHQAENRRVAPSTHGPTAFTFIILGEGRLGNEVDNFWPHNLHASQPSWTKRTPETTLTARETCFDTYQN